MAEKASSWGKNVSYSMANQVGNIAGVEVSSTTDNKVNLRLKNTGMFKTGGTNLSQ